MKLICIHLNMVLVVQGWLLQEYNNTVFTGVIPWFLLRYMSIGSLLFLRFFFTVSWFQKMMREPHSNLWEELEHRLWAELIDQRRRWTSLMLLWLNGSKSLQPRRMYICLKYSWFWSEMFKIRFSMSGEKKINNFSKEQQNLSLSRTIPGQRRRRKCCFERLDPAGQTRCAGYWGAARILGLNTPFWPWGRRSTSSAGSSGHPSHSAHRGDNRWMDDSINLL